MKGGPERYCGCQVNEYCKTLCRKKYTAKEMEEFQVGKPRVVSGKIYYTSCDNGLQLVDMMLFLRLEREQSHFNVGFPCVNIWSVNLEGTRSRKDFTQTMSCARSVLFHRTLSCAKMLLPCAWLLRRWRIVFACSDCQEPLTRPNSFVFGIMAMQEL